MKDSAGFDGAHPAFLSALHAACKEPELATNRLFSIRARGLLFSLTPTDAEATLSGMTIGLGTDGTGNGSGAHDQLAFYTQCGMTPHEAIVAATATNAHTGITALL